MNPPSSSAGDILWTPSAGRAAATRLAAFSKFPSYQELHSWSVAEPGAFWDAVWEFTWVIGSRGGKAMDKPVEQAGTGADMPGARFFPDARLNFAENLLRQTGRSQ